MTVASWLHFPLSGATPGAEMKQRVPLAERTRSVCGSLERRRFIGDKFLTVIGAHRRRGVVVGLERLATLIAQPLVAAMRVQELDVGPQFDRPRSALARLAFDQTTEEAAQPVPAHIAGDIELLQFDDPGFLARHQRDRADDPV